MLLTLLLACTGDNTEYLGTGMVDYFPFDGDRDATYVNSDSALEWSLVAHKAGETEVVDGRESAIFEYSNESGEILYRVKWSTRSNQPVHIDAWGEGTAELTPFDPPLVVTEAYAHTDDAVITETGGRTWTSTYLGPEDCPVLWGGLDWDNCAHIRIDDGDGDDMTGPAFAGDYWFVTRYGPAWMRITGYAEQWTLSDYDWDTGA